MIYGYARVSREDQDLTRQLEALQAAGAQTIFKEKMSGAKKRPELEALISTVQSGDTIIVQKIDRFGRSVVNLLNNIEEIRRKGVGFISLGDNIDISTPSGRLMLNMLASIAEYEREMIIFRVKDGLESARRAGRVGGRPRRLENLEEFRAALERGEDPRQTGMKSWKYYKLRKNILNNKP